MYENDEGPQQNLSTAGVRGGANSVAFGEATPSSSGRSWRQYSTVVLQRSKIGCGSEAQSPATSGP
jgi:hypothetical protein